MVPGRKMQTWSRKQPTLLGVQMEKKLPVGGSVLQPQEVDGRPDGVITTTPYCHFIWMLFLTPLIVRGSAANQGRDLPFRAAVVL